MSIIGMHASRVWGATDTRSVVTPAHATTGYVVASVHSHVGAVSIWAGMYGGYGTQEQASLPLDRIAQPLPVAAPKLWADRIKRVEWCLRNLTAGEKALLYRTLHNGEGLRLDRCSHIERDERQAATLKT